jgi:adenylate kinase family enzyme
MIVKFPSSIYPWLVDYVRKRRIKKKQTEDIKYRRNYTTKTKNKIIHVYDKSGKMEKLDR